MAATMKKKLTVKLDTSVSHNNFNITKIVTTNSVH